MAFKEGQKQKKLDDRTKDVKKIDESVVSEGIETMIDTKSGKSIMDQIQESKTKIEDASSKISKAQKEIDEMYRPKTDEEIEKKFNDESELMKRLEEKIKNMQNVENISTGLTRTIAREILSKRGIELPKGSDPLELFRQKFGQDVLLDVNNLAEELIEMDRMGKRPKSLTSIIEQEGFFDVKMPKEPPQGYTPDELAEIQKEIDQEDILLKFDPTGRKSNSMGGINRLNFATGGIKAIMAIIQFIKTLDPIEAMKEVNKVIARKGKYKNVTDEESQKIFDDTQDHIFEREPKPTEFDIDIDEIESTRKLAPKMTERLEIKAKYPGIDDDLVDKILIDDNPQRKAELLATLDEAFRMMEKGKSTDEIIDTFKNQNRTKQAMGTGPEGLSQITDLYEKIKINNVQKQKDKEDNKQMRFRKLLSSNKFPELNTFLEAELNEDDEKVELDVRTNLAVGGSPFTAQQQAQRKQQSYVDYLARQGVGQSGTTTGPAPTFNPFTGTTPPASGGSQPGTGGGGSTGGGNTNTGNTGGGSTGGGYTGGGGGSSGGGSTGSSGGGSSGGGSNVYTGAGNFPPGMGTNTGGGSTGPSGGGSGLTPNTGASNVGGGGFGGTGSIVGGGTGSTSGYQSRLDEYKSYVERNKNDPRATLSPNNFFTQQELLDNPKLQDAAYKDVYNPGREFQKQVQAGYDTGDLGSEAANDAANNSAKGYVDKDGNPASAFSAKGYEDYLEQHRIMKPNHGAEKGDPLSYADWQYSYGRHMKPDESATADDGFEDQSKDMGADANDGFEDQSYTDDEGNKRITQDMYNQAKLEFLKSEGKIPESATVNQLGLQHGGPRNTSLNLAAKEYIKNKYGTSETLSSNSETAYTQMGGGGDFSQITSLPETSSTAQSIVNETNDQNILQKANEFATKHGKTITAASYLLDAVAPGTGKIIRTAQTLNKGYNIVKGSKDAATNETLNNPQTTQPQNNDLFNQGSASLQFNKGGRVGKAVGGSLDLAARQKQSQLDFLARQPGAQPAQPQPPAVNPQPPAVNPQPPTQAPAPFDMSKYQGGTFTGGIEDSRNIALNQLAGMGIDTSKYSKMTATDTSGPKFQGLSMNEIFAMDLNTAKDKLGFDPSDPDASPEFEEFLRVNDPGPQMIGPGGPPGMKTEFMNQDELSQILNRAIPNYMQKAQEIGEDYTLDEMLAMSDDDLAMLEDRYNNKMGYGQYRPTSNINTGSTDKSQVQETMEEYKDIQNRGTGIGLGSQYATGGRVKLKYGSDRYGQSKKVKSAMNVDYNDPFGKLMSNDSGRFIKSTSSLTRYANKLNKLKNSKQSKAALRKSLLVQNEKTRKDALKKLALLKKLYSGGKSV